MPVENEPIKDMTTKVNEEVDENEPKETVGMEE